MSDKTVEKKGFLGHMTNAGELVYKLFALQFLSAVYTIKGGILFGLFPSVTAVFTVYFKLFMDKDKVETVHPFFKESWKANFKLSNTIGYTLLGLFGFLYIDLRINEELIQSSVLHSILLIIIAIAAFVTIYSFTIISGFELGFKDSLKQSFFVSVSVPKHTIASMLGLMIAYELLKQFAFLAVFFGMPILVLPVAWFTFSGLNAIDTLKSEIAA